MSFYDRPAGEAMFQLLFVWAGAIILGLQFGPGIGVSVWLIVLAIIW